MGEEGVDAMALGTTLLMFVAVVLITISCIFIGKNWMNGYMDKMDSKENTYQLLTFRDFTGEGQDIPVAGAYAFLSYNDRYVNRITCKYGMANCNHATAPTVEGEEDKRATDVYSSCLQTHMTGVCNMKAEFNQEEGGYDITITPVVENVTS